MKVAIIGAGACGLISAKILCDEGIQFDVFDCNTEVGGTWIYSESTTDKYGLPIASSMYKDLRTNLPKEIMEFSGHKYDVVDKSYLTVSEVLEYLQSFSRKFNLEHFIKFEHLVTSISRREKGWELTAKDLKAGSETTTFYEAVFICNGHYTLPNYPNVEGAESFEGLSVHSREYKIPDSYSGKIVLLVGLGPSALDITFSLSPISKKLYISHHGPDLVKFLFPRNVIHKPDMKMIKGNTVYFVDGTSVEVDIILYCTGYKFTFPFLNDNCDINVTNNYVSPLYKHIFSINHPTMVFIGIPFRSFLFPLFELQAKCAVNMLTKKIELVSKDKMLEDMARWENLQISRGYTKEKFHMISDSVYQYFKELEAVGKVTPYPNVLFKIFSRCDMSRKRDLTKYRDEVFEVIDSENFIVK